MIYTYALTELDDLVIRDNDQFTYSEIKSIKNSSNLVPVKKGLIFTESFTDSDIFKWVNSNKFRERKKLKFISSDKSGFTFTDENGTYHTLTNINNLIPKMVNGNLVTTFGYYVERISTRRNHYSYKVKLYEITNEKQNLPTDTDTDTDTDETSVIIWK